MAYHFLLEIHDLPILKKINRINISNMKKFVIILLTVFVCSQTNAQDRTVRGKYKDVEVTITYIPGDPDVITGIKYPLVTELQKQIGRAHV